MNWPAIKALAAVVGVIIVVGSLIYSAGGDRPRTVALEHRVTAVEVAMKEDDREDRERDKTISQMAESIEWIRRWLERQAQRNN
jgi:hypothetical protein